MLSAKKFIKHLSRHLVGRVVRAFGYHTLRSGFESRLSYGRPVLSFSAPQRKLCVSRRVWVCTNHKINILKNTKNKLKIPITFLIFKTTVNHTFLPVILVYKILVFIYFINNTNYYIIHIFVYIIEFFYYIP